MATYTCPVCGETMGRDLILFLSHGDQHIIDEIKKRRPEWVEKDGLCPKCLEYYKGELKGNGPHRCG